MINQKIRSLRELKKLRQEDVAERLGITQHAYSRMETGETKLDVERLKLIAGVLDVPVEVLLNLEPMVITFTQHNNGGTNGYNRHVENHGSEEFIQRLLDRYDARYDAHLRELQQMNARLLELLERRVE